MANVMIIGSGPAGISAALYTIRAGIETTVISKGGGSLEKAEKIENYYGFEQPISGHALQQSGIEGAKRLGVQFVDAEVVGLAYEEKLTVKTNIGDYHADHIIIATGSSRKSPKIDGISEFEGKGVSYCAVCDGFFYRGKDVAVLGCCDYALHEATALLPIAKSVTVLTDSADAMATFPPEINVITKKVKALSGEEKLSTITFEDDSQINVDGLFIAIGVAGSTDLAKKIGIFTDNNKIIVDENMATNIPGIYAAGDCTGGLLQVSKAVYEGAKAGTAVAQSIRKR